MKKLPPMIRFRKTGMVCVGFMLATGLYLTPLGAHDNQTVVSSGSVPRTPQEAAPRQAPDPSTHDPGDGSLIIGDGIRTPPDIGVAGTASPTPSLRFESPTDQPEIFPETTPAPPGSSADPEGFPPAEPAPLEQPEPFNK